MTLARVAPFWVPAPGTEQGIPAVHWLLQVPPLAPSCRLGDQEKKKGAEPSLASDGVGQAVLQLPASGTNYTIGVQSIAGLCLGPSAA